MYLLQAATHDPIAEERAKFDVFGEACRILEEAGIPHVMGGGVAVKAYGRSRYLKDADIFMRYQDVFRAMDALTLGGSFHTRDTDATWLFKALKGDILVDIIVRTTGNIFCTEKTFERGRIFTLHGHPMRMMGPEDLLFRKIHSHREGRPDHFDALSMVKNPIVDFDWDYFLSLAEQNDLQRVLGFFLWAQAELGYEVMPRSVMRWAQRAGDGDGLARRQGGLGRGCLVGACVGLVRLARGDVAAKLRRGRGQGRLRALHEGAGDQGGLFGRVEGLVLEARLSDGLLENRLGVELGHGREARLEVGEDLAPGDVRHEKTCFWATKASV